MNTTEPVKSNARIRVKMIEAIPESLVSKSIIKKSTGSTHIMTLAEGENREVKISLFDTFVQILEGSAEVIIEGISHLLKAGQVLILPAHHPNTIKANVNLRMISTMLKGGEE
jgi:mannose-6-phosphate isomerase-like protein (cupin superfamily)